jgi:hypothetical protein
MAEVMAIIQHPLRYRGDAPNARHLIFQRQARSVTPIAGRTMALGELG